MPFLKTCLEMAEIIVSRSLMIHDVKLIGRYDAPSLAGLTVFRTGIMIATHQILGRSAYRNKALKISSSS